MTARTPAHMRGLSETARATIHAAAVETAAQAPPLSPATREALRVLLRRPAVDTGRRGEAA